MSADQIPITDAQIVQAITQIGDAMKMLRASPIKEATLYKLIQQSSPRIGGGRGRAKYLPNLKPPLRLIKAVLKGLENLAEVHLKTKPEKS